jgi:hypothetical protein
MNGMSPRPRPAFRTPLAQDAAAADARRALRSAPVAQDAHDRRPVPSWRRARRAVPVGAAGP